MLKADNHRWPVIIAIIVVALIAFSFLWCCVRCCCCGMECCCGCFRCFNACCPSPRSKKGHKNLDSTSNNGYPPQNYPQYGGAGATAAPYRQPAPAAPMRYDNTPQFATFDVSKDKPNDDALPAMPSWENASSRKVEVEEQPPSPPGNEKDDVELHQLYENPPSQSQGLITPGQQTEGAGVVGAAANAPHRRPSPDARQNSYGTTAVSQSGVSAYDTQSNIGSDVSGRTDYYNGQQGYGNQAQGYGNTGNGAYGAAAGYGRRSPGPNQGFQQGRVNQGYEQRSPTSYSQSTAPPSYKSTSPTYGQRPAYQQPAYQQPQYQAFNSSQQSFGVTGAQTSPTHGGRGYGQGSPTGPQPSQGHMEEPGSYVGRKPAPGSWRDI